MENHHFQWINPLFLWPYGHFQVRELLVITKGCMECISPTKPRLSQALFGGEGIRAQCSELAPPIE